MRKIKSAYISLLHYCCGFRRAPMTPKRSREILQRNKLYTEVTNAKPLKDWRHNYAPNN